MSFRSRLRELRFRASDRYELVLQDRLRPAERRRFAALEADPEHWGVLRPRGAGTYRAVDRQTALLLYTLAQPGPLPGYVLLDDGERAERVDDQVRAMLIDGILEAETADGEAYDPLSDTGSATDLGVDERSLAALRHAAACGLDEPRALALRLYLYGGEPLSRALCERFATRREVLDAVALGPGGALRRRLPAGWRLDAGPESTWLYLRRAEASGDIGGSGSFKLYVGSSLERLPPILAAVVDSLADSGARSMKIGACAVDLVRTDKVVVYFSTFEALQSFAVAASERLDALGLPGDGADWRVPFTAPAGADGRLSWGVDPPAGAMPVAGTFTESWRSWVASRLASALVAIPPTDISAPSDETRLRAVVGRVRLDGVDVSRWTPTPRLWSDAP